MTDLLDTILRPGGLSVRFQPIFRIRGEMPEVFTLECLTRGPAGTSVRSANMLFTYVRLKRQETELDRLCAAGALRAGSLLPGSPRLAINVHASTLCEDRSFVPYLRARAHELGIGPDRLIVEIVEHEPARYPALLMESLDRLRSSGIEIALDDFGLGFSTLQMVLESKPDFLKLHRQLVHGCHGDPRRTAVIEFVLDLARKLGVRVIAEGIERQCDLRTLLDLGVDLVQGFLFSPPIPGPQVAELLGRGTVSAPFPISGELEDVAGGACCGSRDPHPSWPH